MNTWTPVGAAVAFILGLFTVGEVGQAIGLLIVAVTFLAVGRTRSKDATIKTWREEAEAQEARGDRLQEELVGAQKRANAEAVQVRECEKSIAHLQGEIKTMERYTAQSALEAVAERLTSLESAIVTAVQSQSELTLKNTELAHDSTVVMERVAQAVGDLETQIKARIAAVDAASPSA